MANTDGRVNNHYGLGGLMERIESGLHLAGRTAGSLVVDDLAPIDAFHTRGREATSELAALANLNASDQVLDVGCGLGGTARHLTDRYQCRVVGVDLTDEYITVGTQLTERVGLRERVELRQGNALALPCEDDQFDIVWTEHVQMNIADKKCFYAEIARVLKPGGRLLFHDVFRGGEDPPVYPTPWAEDESLSSLVTGTEARTLMEQVGLKPVQWIDKVAESIDFFKQTLARVKESGPPPLGIHLLMGDNAREKLQNYLCNLSEDRVCVVIGLATRT